MTDFKPEGFSVCAIRSDEEMLSVNREEAENAFKKQKKLLNSFLKEHGFRTYKTNSYIRKNSLDVLEYINLQKEQYGSKRLTVNYALISLRIPHDFLSYDLGDRLGMLICGKDIWWDYADDTAAEISFQNIIQAIAEVLLPWFEKSSSREGLKQELLKVKKIRESYGVCLHHIQQSLLESLDRDETDCSEIIRQNLQVFRISKI